MPTFADRLDQQITRFERLRELTLRMIDALKVRDWELADSIEQKRGSVFESIRQAGREGVDEPSVPLWKRAILNKLVSGQVELNGEMSSLAWAEMNSISDALSMVGKKRNALRGYNHGKNCALFIDKEVR
jgi:hypothetical protein